MSGHSVQETGTKISKYLTAAGVFGCFGISVFSFEVKDVVSLSYVESAWSALSNELYSIRRRAPIVH